MNVDPQAIGRYTVQRVLGRGAMGVVYLAMDPLLKRPVAIKTLLDGGNEDVAITMERFHREAEISARLNHPNIITVFDVGSDPKVGPFLAMEYIEGASLSALIRKRLHPDTGMRLLIQGMSALMAAEQGGIIHRDIKSENMLVSREGRLKLMDFGIARRNESRLTQAGMVFGTPSYTAPELLLGGEPSAVTDRYAFTVTAFEVITGQLPFLGSSVASILYKVVHEPPELPVDADSALAEVFHKALAKDPAERYQNLPNFMLALALALPLSEEQRARLLSMLERDEPMSHGMGSGVLPEEPLPDYDGQGSDELAVSLPRASVPFQPEPQSLSQAQPGALPPPPHPTRSHRLKWLGAVGFLLLAAGGAYGWKLAHPPTHPLVIHSQPAGADVYLNGKLMGRTPLGPIPIRDDRAKGLIRVELAGYETLQAELEDDDKLLEYTLQRTSYDLQVVSDPPGATAALNGSAKGKTPLRLSVPGSGAQELVLQLDGYEEWKAQLDRDAPFPTPIRLTPASFQVAVTSEPKGAEAWLDSKRLGRTPLPSVEVSGVGPHELRLKLAGYDDWTGRLTKGSPLPRPIRLHQRMAKFDIRTEPSGATLLLDGKPAGTSPATLEVPLLGSHTLRLSLDGYEPQHLPLDPAKPPPNPIRLTAVKKAEPAKPKEEKKPGFWKRVFGDRKKEEKKD